MSARSEDRLMYRLPRPKNESRGSATRLSRHELLQHCLGQRELPPPRHSVREHAPQPRVGRPRLFGELVERRLRLCAVGLLRERGADGAQQGRRRRRRVRSEEHLVQRGEALVGGEVVAGGGARAHTGGAEGGFGGRLCGGGVAHHIRGREAAGGGGGGDRLLEECRVRGAALAEDEAVLLEGAAGGVVAPVRDGDLLARRHRAQRPQHDPALVRCEVCRRHRGVLAHVQEGDEAERVTAAEREAAARHQRVRPAQRRRHQPARRLAAARHVPRRGGVRLVRHERCVQVGEQLVARGGGGGDGRLAEFGEQLGGQADRRAQLVRQRQEAAVRVPQLAAAAGRRLEHGEGESDVPCRPALEHGLANLLAQIARRVPHQVRLAGEAADRARAVRGEQEAARHGERDLVTAEVASGDEGAAAGPVAAQRD
mmetsp:Transcript_8951/g.28712  ORF Transcript_8951/g.28712 Transcript_8951/m.28712 type:complete len:427 (+) Transcript_8951:37-1317(+)